MRILYLDLDTLRPDHLGCYGYNRDTSPNIDSLAREGVRFENCCVSDAPCLPSRSALYQCRFGIHTGVINHGGVAADPFPEGYPVRQFRLSDERLGWMGRLRQAGFHTVSISPFAERHSAWWFCEGFNEMYNPGKTGNERADEVAPIALDWIRRNAKRDNWFLQVNFWDPHTQYRTPASYGNPFAGKPIPAWYTEEIRKQQWESFGAFSANERRPVGKATFSPLTDDRFTSLDDFRKWIDGYDVGIRYMDDHIGMLFAELAQQGVMDDLVVIVSSDHGENQGELNVYGDHHYADYVTSRVPLIVRWPGVTKARVDSGLYYQSDMAATVTELAGGGCSPRWDGRSFADAVRKAQSAGRDHLVLSQAAWTCQRAARFEDHIVIRTYHAGLNDLPEWMVFDVKNDPHETKNLADTRCDLVGKGARIIDDWQVEMMGTSVSGVDPMWTVLREGGPHHARKESERFCKRLRESGRAHQADIIEKRFAPGRQL